MTRKSSKTQTSSQPADRFSGAQVGDYVSFFDGPGVMPGDNLGRIERFWEDRWGKWADVRIVSGHSYYIGRNETVASIEPADAKGIGVRLMEWTPELVKYHLPKVNVKTATGEVIEASVGGRMRPFAALNWGDNSWCEAAWETVANVLNRRTAVLV